MTETVVTAAEIASHLACPRQYEFEHDRPLAPRETDRSRVRERRQELLRRSILAGLRVDTTSSDDRVAAALERFERTWDASETSYLSEDQLRYDEKAIRSSIESYLSGTGHEHGNNLVASETTLGYERDGVRYETTVDAVVGRDGQYLAIRYVPDTNGILRVSWYDDNVDRFTDGRGFYPRQIGSFATAAIAIRGLMDEHGLRPTYDFAYVSLLDGSRPSYTDPADVHVDIEQRHFGEAYETEKPELNALIEDRAAAIRREETDPREWRFDEIMDQSCEFCPYQDACPDYMESTLSFTDRQQSDSSESPVHPAATDHPPEGD